jgi:hypothetical protein
MITTNNIGVTSSNIELINVVPINMAPINNIPVTQNALENQSLVFTGTGHTISISDHFGTAPASTTIMGFQLTSTNGVLTLPNTAGLTGIYSSTSTSYSSVNTSATGWFYGTEAAINNALNGLIFTPTVNWSGTGSVTITSYDYHGVNTATTVNVTVAAVNQAPINNVPASVGVAKNTNFTFNGANQISISDVDDANATMKVDLTVANGTVTLGSTTGISFINSTTNNSAHLTFNATKTNINSALNNLVFRPTTGFTGVASITLYTDDQGNTGSGGIKSDTNIINISVNATTTNYPAPVNSIPVNQTLAENGTLIFSTANNNAIMIADPNVGDNPVINVTLASSNGTFTLASTNNIEIAGGKTSNNLSSVTISGTLNDINNSLNGLQFTGNSNFTGTANLQITSYDEGNVGTLGTVGSSTNTVNIQVAPINMAPITKIVNTTNTINENSSLTINNLSKETCHGLSMLRKTLNQWCLSG